MDAQGMNLETVLIASALTQLATFLGVLATLVFGYMRDGRTRKWLRQDRDDAVKETQATARALLEHQAVVANDLKSAALEKASAIQIRLEQVAGAVGETRMAADAAYREANHVNQKIAGLGASALANAAAASAIAGGRHVADLVGIVDNKPAPD